MGQQRVCQTRKYRRSQNSGGQQIRACAKKTAAGFRSRITVARLSYADHALTLTLADAGEQAQRVAETPALVQQAAALGLKLERGDKDATWRITPAQP